MKPPVRDVGSQAGRSSARPGPAPGSAGTAGSAGTLRDQAVRRRLGRRQAEAEQDVHRLIEAGRVLMVTGGDAPRVADIVRAAGLSNDAFYRFFRSRDELVAAVVEDGAQRLLSYARHRRDGGATPADRLRRCLDAIIDQAADPVVAASTRAVFRNASGRLPGHDVSRSDFDAAFAELLADPLRELGAADPERDARATAALALGVMTFFLWREERPGPDDVEHLYRFARRGAAIPDDPAPAPG